MSRDETTTPDVESDLSRYPLPRLIFYLYKRQFTGRLQLARPADDPSAGQGSQQSVRVFFRDGLPCHVEMRAMEDVLGRVLLERGWIDQDQYNTSLAELALGGKLHGQILLQMGAIETSQLVAGLQLQLRRKLNRLFHYRGAPFALYSEDHRYGVDAEEQTVRADPLWLIYQGVRNAFDQARLAPELDKLRGSSVRLDASFGPYLDRYGLSAEEKHFAQVLMHGAVGFERALKISNLSSRVESEMLLYALWVTEGLVVSSAPAAAAESPPQAPTRSLAPEQAQRPGTAPSLAALVSDFGAGSAEPEAAAGAPVAPPPPASAPVVPPPPASAPVAPPPPSSAAGGGGVGRYRSAAPAVEPAVPAPRARKDTGGAALAERIEQHLRGIEQKSHFEVLGVERGSSAADARDAYYKLAKEFHPDRVGGLGCDEQVRERAEELFRRIGEAHSTLADSRLRVEYEKSLDEPDVADEARALLEAEMAFQRGTVFFKKRDYSQAVEQFAEAWRLNDREGEHLAWLAWARYCDPKSDKKSMLLSTIDDLRAAIKTSPKRAQAHYFLGEALVVKGEDRRAIASFEKVVELNKHHVDALRQLRLLRMRQQKGDQDAGAGGRLKSITKLFKK